jgi:hypothetical protein
MKLENMNQLQAVDLLETLTIDELQSLMPAEVVPTSTTGACNDRGRLVFFVAAGCSLSGQLDDCTTLDDLRESFGDFVTLWNGGIIGDEAWGNEATDILQQAEACALQLAMEIGNEIERDSKFSRAELN